MPYRIVRIKQTVLNPAVTQNHCGALKKKKKERKLHCRGPGEPEGKPALVIDLERDKERIL